jgi:UDP-N-acetylmuramoylalanine--D-glutamate ligase
VKIAIAGYGLEGRANLAYFRAKFPTAEFVIFDEKVALDDAPAGVKTVLGEDAFSQIKGFDLVVRTAGLPPRKIGQPDNHWSSTREFFAECEAKNVPIIGVTGTKGKGTTCSFITEILRARFASVSSCVSREAREDGERVSDEPRDDVREERLRETQLETHTVHLVGNIGVPALEILPKIAAGDVVVYELSSFQLWDIDRSPQVAVMTLLETDHMDVHADFAEYTNTKARIFQFQKLDDAAVYNEDDALVREMAESATKQTGAAKIPFLNKKFVHIEQGKFYYNDIEICPTDAVKLPGEHNLRNAAAAISAVVSLILTPSSSEDVLLTQRMSNTSRSATPSSLNGSKIKETIFDLREAISVGLANFHGLPHRLKFVREVAGVKYYDDSIATTPGSAIAAVKSFDGPKTLIIGGHDKGADYRTLGETIEQSGVRQIFAIGANREKVARQLAEKTSTPIHKLENQNMAEIVQIVSRASQSGDVVILSPAAASFDMFHDYKDRGEQFIAAVRGLMEK